MRLGAVCIASGLGSGYSKVAPGTCGSLAALVVWWVLNTGSAQSAGGGAVLTIVLAVLGVISIELGVGASSLHQDPKWVVIDEWAGLFLALAPVRPGEWGYIICAFGLFRFLDASKLGPVGLAETLPGALGIMADDLVAGGLTAIAILVVRSIV